MKNRYFDLRFSSFLRFLISEPCQSSYDKDHKYGFCHETCLHNNKKYMKGEKWEQIGEKGRRMLCECVGNGNSEWRCIPIDMCEQYGSKFFDRCQIQ